MRNMAHKPMIIMAVCVYDEFHKQKTFCGDYVVVE